MSNVAHNDIRAPAPAPPQERPASHASLIPHHFRFRRRTILTPAATAAVLLLFATVAHAQNSQFLFDANGNLLVQTAETSAPPQIIGQPQNRVVVPGETASFFVVAADTRALTYQWRFNGANMGGATNDALLLQNVGTNHEGQYSVVLTNSSGSVTSVPALLMIDSDADGVADSWERNFFTNLNQNATADFDGDGVSNLQEFLDGTNPTNSVSVRYRVFLSADGGTIVKTPDQTSYTNGETVTLTAVASSNAPFRAWLGDIVTRSNSITLVMTNNKTVFARFTPIAFTWTGPSGDWDVAVNWTPNLAPGTNDSVIINSSVTVTLNRPADCSEVTFGAASPTLAGSGSLTVRNNLSWVAGAVTVSGNLTVLGNCSWTSGTMGGGGRTIIETGATLNMVNPGALSLNSRTLENGGTVLWTGVGGLVMNPTTVITNRAGALFEMQNAVTITANNGIVRFDNGGTFRKSVNPGTITVPGSVNFNNSGTVDIQTGTLSLGAGTHSGSFTVPAGTALNLADATHTASGVSSITGGGQLIVSGGTATLAGLVNVTGSNMFSGGTVNFTGNTICTNNTITISGGTANFSGTGSVSPAVLNLSNGTLGGNSTVTVLNAMNWTGGTMSGNGRTIIPAGVTLNIPNPGAVIMNGRTLENGGTVLWTGAGSLVMNPPAAITNRPGALFEIQNAVTLVANNGLCRFDNAGTFRKSVNAGTITFPGSVTFNNSGTVNIRSGIFAADSYVFSPNALLNCALGGTMAGSGYGRLQVAGAVTLNGSLSVDLINGFVPAINDSFTVLTAGTRNGTFASFSYPANRVTMQLSNTPNSVLLSVSEVFPVPQPVLLTPQLVASNAMLSWTATSNVTYRLEFNPDLNSSNWSAVPGDVTTLSNTASKLDPLTLSNRLYRVRVIP